MTDIRNIDFEELWEFCRTAKKQYSTLFYFDGNEINRVQTRYNYSSKINEYLKDRETILKAMEVAYVLIQMGLIGEAQIDA